MGMMGFGGFGMMFWVVIFWLLVVGVALWLLTRLFPGARRRSATEGPPDGSPAIGESGRALDILKERYARGEITQADYQAIRKDIA